MRAYASVKRVPRKCAIIRPPCTFDECKSNLPFPAQIICEQITLNKSTEVDHYFSISFEPKFLAYVTPWGHLHLPAPQSIRRVATMCRCKAVSQSCVLALLRLLIIRDQWNSEKMVCGKDGEMGGMARFVLMNVLALFPRVNVRNW